MLLEDSSITPTFAQMTTQQRDGLESLKEFIGSLTGKLTDEVYQHVGEPLYFTTQKGTIAGNHNLYKKLIERAIPGCKI